MLKIKTGNFLFLLIYGIVFILKMLERFEYIAIGNYSDFILYGLLMILGIIFSFKNLGSGKSFINFNVMTKGKVLKSIIIGIIIGFFSLLSIIKFNMNPTILIGDYDTLVISILFMIVFILGSEIFFRGFLLGLYKTKDRFLGIIFAAILYSITFKGFGSSAYYFIIALLMSLVVISSKSIINNVIIMGINLLLISMYHFKAFNSVIERLLNEIYSLGFIFYGIIVFLVLLGLILISSFRERANDYTRITGDEGFLGRKKESIITWHIIIVFLLFIIAKVDVFIK